MTDKADTAPSQTDIPANIDAEDDFDAEMPQDDFDADIDGETDLVEVEIPEEDLPRERIAKRIARSGVCSRRDAEQLIKTGKVKLNGRRLDTPAVTVTDNDVILINEKPLPEKQKPRLWRLFKKRGLVTSHRDEQGRETVFNSLPPHIPRVISVGRLDLNSEGLLLLTNDGELARYLELPATGWARRYRVRVHGFIDDSKLKQLADGITVDGVNYGSIQAEVDVQKGTNAWMTITLREGKNREIRRVMEHLGWPVTRLMRLSYGPFHLGKMAPGDIEEITGKVMKEQLTGFFGGDGSKAAAKRDNDNHGQAKAKPKKPKAHRKTPARSDSRGGPRDADTGTSLKSTGPRPFENDSRSGGYNERAPAGRGRDHDRDDNRGFGRDDNARRSAPQNRSFGGGNDRGDRNDRSGNDTRGGYNDRAPAGRGRDNDRDDNRGSGRDDNARRGAPQNRSFGGGNDRGDRNDRSGNDTRGGYNDRAPAGRGRDNDRDDNRGFGRDDNARRGAPQNRSFGGGNDRGDRNDNDSRDGGYQGRSSGRGRDSQNRDNNTAGNRSFGGQGQPSGRGGNPRNRDDAGENRDNTSRPLNKGRGRYAGGNAGAGKPAGRPGGNTGSKPAGNRPAGRNGPKPAGNGKRGDR